MAKKTVAVGDPTEADDHNDITTYGDADHDWDDSTGSGHHKATIHFETALTATTIALMWWEDSSGSLWLLGKTGETDTFTRAEAQFYIPLGNISDVPTS